MTRNTTSIIVGTLAAAVLAGAAAVDAKKVFSHKYHVGEAGADCATCHDAAKGDPPQLIKESCGNCHGEGTPSRRKSLVTVGGDKGTPPWKLGAHARRLHIKFPHQHHTAIKGVECKTCHAAIASDGLSDGKPILGFDQCTACYRERKAPVAPNACAKCHSGSSGGEVTPSPQSSASSAGGGRGTDAKAAKPPDHLVGWTARHGEASRWVEKGEHGKDCALCHSGSGGGGGAGTCRACHMQSTPKDHTGLWRARTHGIEAGWDRERCKACHETGTCVRCHAQSKPMNHAGPWKAAHGLTAGSHSNEHCKACHQQGWCNSCLRSSR